MSRTQLTPTFPVWYQAEAPLGSAVRYVAGLSPRFDWVGLYVLRGKDLELGPSIGPATKRTRIRVGKGVCGIAAVENADQNIPDVHAHENYLAWNPDTQSELVVLIRDKRGKVLGQIDVGSRTRAAFGPEEEKAVRQVAQELGELWPE